MGESGTEILAYYALDTDSLWNRLDIAAGVICSMAAEQIPHAAAHLLHGYNSSGVGSRLVPPFPL